MSNPPDDSKNPWDPGDHEESGDGGANKPQGPFGVPPGAQKRQIKVSIPPDATVVRFSDMFGFMLAPTHGLIKFGVFQPETGEFIVHTQIAMTPQGMVALSQALQQNLEQVRKNNPGGKSQMN